MDNDAIRFIRFALESHEKIMNKNNVNETKYKHVKSTSTASLNSCKNIFESPKRVYGHGIWQDFK